MAQRRDSKGQFAGGGGGRKGSSRSSGRRALRSVMRKRDERLIMGHDGVKRTAREHARRILGRK